MKNLFTKCALVAFFLGQISRFALADDTEADATGIAAVKEAIPQDAGKIALYRVENCFIELGKHATSGVATKFDLIKMKDKTKPDEICGETYVKELDEALGELLLKFNSEASDYAQNDKLQVPCENSVIRKGVLDALLQLRTTILTKDVSNSSGTATYAALALAVLSLIGVVVVLILHCTKSE